jgi:hypothetical protein
MDVKQYRREYEERLRRAKRRSGGGDGLEAASLGFQRAGDRGDAVATGSDELLALVRDRAAPPGRRHAALQQLKAANFAGGFDAFRPEFHQALRELATDPDEELRRSALDALAHEKDEYAQKLLIDGLREPGKALVPPAVALQFLSHDDHAPFAQLALALLRKESDTATQTQALRALAGAPAAEELFTDLIKDKELTREVRQASAVSLQALNPAEFLRVARDIVEDDDEFDDIRATALRGLAGAAPTAEEAPREFVAKVRSLEAASESGSLAQAAKRFLKRRGED